MFLGSQRAAAPRGLDALRAAGAGRVTYSGRPAVPAPSLAAGVGGAAGQNPHAALFNGAATVVLSPADEEEDDAQQQQDRLPNTTTTSTAAAAAEAVGTLFLGSQRAAAPRGLDALRAARVGAILNCTPSFPSHFAREGVAYARVNVNDESSANLRPYLTSATDFIRHHLVARRVSVLVHCQMGISRSSTIVLAYLIRFEGMTRDEAYVHVKSRRPQCDPNPGFWRQLKTFESRLRRERKKRREVDAAASGNVAAAEAAAGDDVGAAAAAAPAFDLQWCEASVAKYSMARDTGAFCFGDEVSAVSTAADAARIVEGALDFVYGRGARAAEDVEWLTLLCNTMPATAAAAAAADARLRADSEWFTDKWVGEFNAATVGKLRRALGLSELN